MKYQSQPFLSHHNNKNVREPNTKYSLSEYHTTQNNFRNFISSKHMTKRNVNVLVAGYSLWVVEFWIFWFLFFTKDGHSKYPQLIEAAAAAVGPLFILFLPHICYQAYLSKGEKKQEIQKSFFRIIKKSITPL